MDSSQQALATIIAALIEEHDYNREDFWEVLPKQAALLLYTAELEYASMHLTEVPPDEERS
jgi:hypothetical protein